MTRNHDAVLIFLMVCVLVMSLLSFLSGCAIITAIAPGIVRALILHKITEKGDPDEQRRYDETDGQEDVRPELRKDLRQEGDTEFVPDGG